MELIDRANSIEKSAKRLYKLVCLNAPGLIIENERHLLLKKLISFPADSGYIATRESVNEGVKQQEQDWLKKTGYYDEIAKELGLDDGVNHD